MYTVYTEGTVPIVYTKNRVVLIKGNRSVYEKEFYVLDGCCLSHTDTQKVQKYLQVSVKNRIFARRNKDNWIMTTIALDQETSNYWEMIKGASKNAKLMLLTLISASMTDEEVIITHKKPMEAHRICVMTDDQMEQEMEGAPTPIMVSEEADPSDIVEANRGKVANGLEKWL